MNEIINKYPSLVAVPYLTIAEGIQKKDMQRFWFENTVSFLAIVAGADLVYWYRELKEKEDKTDKDIEMIKLIQNNPSLTSVGLDNMSLGKWVMMLRESTKLLKELNVNAFFPEIIDFYYGDNGRENEKTINKFVQLRNEDAHGNPIPQDRLEHELNKRQEMIDMLIDSLSFLQNYKLVLVDGFELERNKHFYILKEFIGNSVVTSRTELDFSPRINDVILVNSKNNKFLSLLPNITYLGTVDENLNFLGIFSKFIHKDKKIAKYLNLRGYGEVDFEKTDEIYGIDFIEERKEWNEIYSDPKSRRVNLNLNFEFEDNTIKVEEESKFSLVIDNRKSAPIENMKITIDIPPVFSIIKEDLVNEAVVNFDIKGSQFNIQLSNLDEELIKIEDIRFKISEQGVLSLDNIFVTYDYYNSDADEDAGILTTDEMTFEGSVIEVVDPASRDKMIPLLAVEKKFISLDEKPINRVKVAEDFIFEIKLKNIGFSSAKDIILDVIFPDGLNIKKGKESIKISRLNPLEEKVFQYILSSVEPNIYLISVQNIIYSDLNDKRHSTRCGDDCFMVVRSDILTEFKLKIKSFIQDLYISPQEQKEMDKTIQEIKEKLNIDAEDFQKQTEYAAAIDTIRKIIETLSKKKNIKVQETIYEEGKRDSKLTGKKSRKFLVFSSKIPFFAINLVTDEPEFYGLKTNITKKFDEVKEGVAVVGSGSFTLEHMLYYDIVRNTEKYSVQFFNQWINMILSRVENEYFVWKRIADKMGDIFSTDLRYINGQYSSNGSIDSIINECLVFMDRDEPKKYAVCYRINRSKNYRESELKEVDIYCTPKIGKSESFGNGRFSYYWIKSKKKTHPAVEMRVESSEDENVIIDKAKKLYRKLQYIHSLDLIDDMGIPDFSNELKELALKLYQTGFVLRKNDESDKSQKIEVIPLGDYNDDLPASEAIAYFENSKRGLNIYIKSYGDLNDELAQDVCIEKFYWLKDIPNYLIRVKNIKSEDVMKRALEHIMNTALEYDKNKKFVWPRPFQKELIVNYGRVEYSFFIFLKAIKNGVNETKDLMPLLSNELEYIRAIKRIKKLENEFKILPVIKIKDEILTINDYYDDVINEMYLENPDFDYIEDGEAMYRMYFLELLPLMRVYTDIGMGRRWAYKNLKISSEFTQKATTGFAFLKGKVIQCYAEFLDINNRDSFINRIYEKDNVKNFIEENDCTVRDSGRQNQHLKLEYKIKFQRFKEEKERVADNINEFFEIIKEIIENIS